MKARSLNRRNCNDCWSCVAKTMTRHHYQASLPKHSVKYPDNHAPPIFQYLQQKTLTLSFSTRPAAPANQKAQCTPNRTSFIRTKLTVMKCCGCAKAIAYSLH